MRQGGKGLTVCWTELDQLSITIQCRLGSRDRGYHGGLGIPAQGLLQQPGQDRISVWHEVVLLPFALDRLTARLSQSSDHFAEGGERFVDVGALSQTSALDGQLYLAS